MRHQKLHPDLIEAISADLHSDKPLLAKFNGSTSMSTLASRKLLPMLRTGMIYSDACTNIYGDHRQNDFSFDSITNPVVESVVREVLKQVTCLINETGKLPGRICVEIGRDLGKSVKERNEISRGQADRVKNRNANRTNLEKHINRKCTDDELLRYELALEQSFTCPYSGEHLGKPVDILSNEFEVDHILPRSRSLDNSYDNKVLVHRKYNQNKRNATPFEFFGRKSKESPEWLSFTAKIANLQGLRKQKRRNLLNTTFAEDETALASRHLNDTRYIAKLVTAYLQAFYELAGEKPQQEKGGKRRVYVQPGPMTALIRKSWGLEDLKKDLQGNRIGDKHHAVDALICALVSEGQRQFITRKVQGRTNAINEVDVFGEIAKTYQLMEQKNEHHRIPKGISIPWKGFRNDVASALDAMQVSRAENRKGRGSLHNETYYKQGPDLHLYASKSIAAISQDGLLNTKAHIARVKDIHQPANSWLKKELEKWIKNGCPVDDPPAYRCSDPALTTKVIPVRKLSLASLDKNLKKTIQHSRSTPNGIVTGGDQVRLDVFSTERPSRKKVYHLVPIYTYQIRKGSLPPRKYVITGKKNQNEDLWPELSPKAKFEFSLWPNDLFRIRLKATKKKPDGMECWGVYSGFNRKTTRIAYADPNDHKSRTGKPKDNASMNDGISVGRDAVEFQKYHVDRLGRIHAVRSEKRTWLGQVSE